MYLFNSTSCLVAVIYLENVKYALAFICITILYDLYRSLYCLFYVVVSWVMGWILILFLSREGTYNCTSKNLILSFCPIHMFFIVTYDSGISVQVYVESKIILAWFCCIALSVLTIVQLTLLSILQEARVRKNKYAIDLYLESIRFYFTFIFIKQCKLHHHSQ